MKSKKEHKSWWKIIIFGAVIGFLNGFFGGGGGMACVPLLEEGLKLENKKAHATALACMLPLSVVSSIIYLFKNDLSISLLGISSLFVTVGGILGAILLKKLSSKTVRIIFICIMLIAGLRLVL